MNGQPVGPTRPTEDDQSRSASESVNAGNGCGEQDERQHRDLEPGCAFHGTPDTPPAVTNQFASWGEPGNSGPLGRPIFIPAGDTSPASSRCADETPG